MPAERFSTMKRFASRRIFIRSASGFSLIEVMVGIGIVAFLLVVAGMYSKGNRKTMGKSNKTSQSYYVATTWTEGIKTWYADTNLYPLSSPKKTRYDTLFSKVGPTGSFDTSNANYVRDSVHYTAKFTITRTGNLMDSMLLARGTVTWDSLSTTDKQTFTWGLVLSKPLR